MLTCRQFTDELGDYLDDTLRDAERAALDRHAQECAGGIGDAAFGRNSNEDGLDALGTC